jgi:hypothetical protein
MLDGKTPDQIGESICTDLTKAWETFVEHVQRTLARYEWLREYFKHKPRLERVCGCLTWQDYCENKLGKTARAVHYAMNGRPEAKPKELPEATEAATFDVEEAISRSLLYLQSIYEKSSTADRVAVIDGLIERLRSERDLITTRDAQRQECENTPLPHVPQGPEFEGVLQN